MKKLTMHRAVGPKMIDLRMMPGIIRTKKSLVRVI